MARSYGFGRGALHGALIGAGALAVLSLALPGPQTRPAVPEAGESARPEVGVDAGPAAPATGAGPAGDAPAPPVPDDDGGLSAPQAESGQGPDAVMQEAGGVAGGGAGVLSPAARTGGAGIAPDAVTDSRPSGGDDTGVPVTRMSPPPGSEFARREDLPPVVPAPSAAPGLGQSAAPAVSVPVAENAPQAATLPGARPDPLSAADTLQPVEDQPAGPATPAPDPARPATAPAPGAVDAPARDTGPMPASRAAPAPPPEDEVTILPGSEGRPATAGSAARPDPAAASPAGPAPATGDRAPAGTARPAPPVLQAPDPGRESVPPPPAAAAQESAAPVRGGSAALPTPDGRASAAPALPDATAVIPAPEGWQRTGRSDFGDGGPAADADALSAQGGPVATMPGDRTPRDSTPPGTTPRDSAPRDTTPAATTPADTTPPATTPPDTTPSDTTPAATTPPDRIAPDRTTPDRTVPGRAAAPSGLPAPDLAIPTLPPMDQP